MNWAFPTVGMQHPVITPCTGERWAEPAQLKMLKVREGGQGWSFLVAQDVPLSPASLSPPAWPISPSPGTKQGFISACSVSLLGQASGLICPTEGCSLHLSKGAALREETFFQAMLFFAFSFFVEAMQKPARLLPATA